VTGFLGVLMLETRFPRPPGDAGNPASYAMPVQFAVVRGATPLRVVRAATDPDLLQPFVDAARSLVAQGARAITTSCGFLVGFQRALQDSVPVPVWSSGLLKLPELARPGVLTVDARSLGAAHLRAAGGREDTPIEGLAPGGTLQRTLLHDLPSLDVQRAEAEVVAAAKRLLDRHPEIDSLVLECTNMPPYAAAVQRGTGRPVHHLLTLVHERWNAP
jgi:hypothetical protein